MERGGERERDHSNYHKSIIAHVSWGVGNDLAVLRANCISFKLIA